MPLLLYPAAFKAPSVPMVSWSGIMKIVVLLSLYPFFSVPLVILKYHFPQPLESRIKGLALIGLGELLDELHQVGVLGDHKGGDGDVEFSGLLCHGITLLHDII